MEIFAKDSDSVLNGLSQAGPSYVDIINKHLPLKGIERSEAVPGSAQNGYSPVFRNSAIGAVKKFMLPELNTYHAMWKNAVAHFGGKPALAHRPFDYKTRTSEPIYVSETFDQVEAKKLQFGSGLLRLLENNPFLVAGMEAHDKIKNHHRDFRGYNADNFSFVLTMFSSNRPEWVLSDLACIAYSITNTVLYDTLGSQASQYILSLLESPVVVLSYEHISTILALKKDHPEDLQSLVALVSMDPLDCSSALEGRSLVEHARSLGVELFDMNQVLGVGKLFPRGEMAPSPETPYTISFTSGTTGSNPKGVVLTQENAAAGVTFITCMAPAIEDDIEFAFLPLAHIFERQALAYNLTKGGMSGFPQLGGGPLTLLEDLKLLRPKHMANVPRVYTKLESAIKNATLALDSALKRSIFSLVLATKEGRQNTDGAKGEHWLYDRTVIQKLRKQLGFDRMVYCITGLAPISPLTMKFMKAALNMGFAQGYGLTESFAGFSFSEQYEVDSSSCGAPGVCSEIRVRGLPDLGYSVDDPRGHMGELEIRGPQVFHHYYKNREETDKVLKDGWFSTGDVARIDPTSGRLYIVDRVKNFFKLSQGEYVTPEKVESLYLLANPILTQCFSHGESLRSYLVGVVGVDKEQIVGFLKRECGVAPQQLGLDDEILAQINKKPNRAKLLHQLNASTSGLSGFEKMKNLFVEFEPLTLERDVITPTVKIRRPIAAKFFKDQIAAMYEEGELNLGAKL